MVNKCRVCGSNCETGNVFCSLKCLSIYEDRLKNGVCGACGRSTQFCDGACMDVPEWGDSTCE